MPKVLFNRKVSGSQIIPPLILQEALKLCQISAPVKYETPEKYIDRFPSKGPHEIAGFFTWMNYGCDEYWYELGKRIDKVEISFLIKDTFCPIAETLVMREVNYGSEWIARGTIVQRVYDYRLKKKQ
jgi:hypothetical protein